MLLADNRLDTGYLTLTTHKAALENMATLGQSGHRSEVRTLAMSQDNQTILSASGEEVKLWNR